MEKTVLTVEELANRWQVSKMTILRLIRKNEIRAIKIGHGWRIPCDAVCSIEKGALIH